MLKEQLLWVRFFATFEELRVDLASSPRNTTTHGFDSATDARRQIESGSNNADFQTMSLPD
jgi:hypothetical protein